MPEGRDSETIVDLARAQAQARPHAVAFSFAVDGEAAEERMSYAELDLGARRVATALQQVVTAGDRVLILHPPGLDFITAFLGCLYAGAAAVPAYPPDPTRLEPSIERLRGILRTCAPAAVLVDEALVASRPQLGAMAPELDRVVWVDPTQVSAARAEEWVDRPRCGDTVAFLQFTSGSTSAPKGVVLKHANLLHNQRVIRDFTHQEEGRFAGWLPTYHDMGLIGNVMQSLYLGIPCFLLSPFHFLQQPIRWLRLITRHRATISGAPNFAYELCVRRVAAEERRTLDLSSWEVAFNGAEPVQADTLRRFSEWFRPCGFRAEAIYPCYGLAEATLMITGGGKLSRPAVVRVDASAMAAGEVREAQRGAGGGRELVACGRAGSETDVVIVNPDSLCRAPAQAIGEIWVSSPSVASGYWNDREESARSFGARLATGEGPFLRTGDLGFLRDGELYVTGRVKELIIIRGRKLYPLDIERAAQQAHPALRPGCGAAFALATDEGELPILVQEVDTRVDVLPEDVFRKVRGAVSEAYQVTLAGITLIPPRTIPKTPSGKVQRFICRDRYVAGGLEVLAQWTAGRPSASVGGAPDELRP